MAAVSAPAVDLGVRSRFSTSAGCQWAEIEELADDTPSGLKWILVHKLRLTTPVELQGAEPNGRPLNLAAVRMRRSESVVVGTKLSNSFESAPFLGEFAQRLMAICGCLRLTFGWLLADFVWISDDEFFQTGQARRPPRRRECTKQPRLLAIPGPFPEHCL